MRSTVIGVRVHDGELALLRTLAHLNDLPLGTAVRREALRAARRLVGRSKGEREPDAEELPAAKREPAPART